MHLEYRRAVHHLERELSPQFGGLGVVLVRRCWVLPNAGSIYLRGKTAVTRVSARARGEADAELQY